MLVLFQKTLVWLQKREDRLKEFQPVASNFDTIKDQWNEVKVCKNILVASKTMSFYANKASKSSFRVMTTYLPLLLEQDMNRL